ncbi:hypothetical protein BLNAU_11563 [Blattamonas nauphoetae]|uniref:Uncharacterized protein n=1 Tax=Blattamonas nauphoetae TaxID=2049346 RepID=A0ABQ9XQF1_9EUKA|nr:hypothetical protein BLNAU_11563 [Blattamonas nauphoetae]
MDQLFLYDDAEENITMTTPASVQRQTTFPQMDNSFLASQSPQFPKTSRKRYVICESINGEPLIQTPTTYKKENMLNGNSNLIHNQTPSRPQHKPASVLTPTRTPLQATPSLNKPTPHVQFSKTPSQDKIPTPALTSRSPAPETPRSRPQSPAAAFRPKSPSTINRPKSPSVSQKLPTPSTLPRPKSPTPFKLTTPSTLKKTPSHPRSVVFAENTVGDTPMRPLFTSSLLNTPQVMQVPAPTPFNTPSSSLKEDITPANTSSNTEEGASTNRSARQAVTIETLEPTELEANQPEHTAETPQTQTRKSIVKDSGMSVGYTPRHSMLFTPPSEGHRSSVLRTVSRPSLSTVQVTQDQKVSSPLLSPQSDIPDDHAEISFAVEHPLSFEAVDAEEGETADTIETAPPTFESIEEIKTPSLPVKEIQMSSVPVNETAEDNQIEQIPFQDVPKENQTEDQAAPAEEVIQEPVQDEEQSPNTELYFEQDDVLGEASPSEMVKDHNEDSSITTEIVTEEQIPITFQAQPEMIEMDCQTEAMLVDTDEVQTLSFEELLAAQQPTMADADCWAMPEYQQMDCQTDPTPVDVQEVQTLSFQECLDQQKPTVTDASCWASVDFSVMEIQTDPVQFENVEETQKMVTVLDRLSKENGKLFSESLIWKNQEKDLMHQVKESQAAVQQRDSVINEMTEGIQNFAAESDKLQTMLSAEFEKIEKVALKNRELKTELEQMKTMAEEMKMALTSKFEKDLQSEQMKNAVLDKQVSLQNQQLVELKSSKALRENELSTAKETVMSLKYQLESVLNDRELKEKRLKDSGAQLLQEKEDLEKRFAKLETSRNMDLEEIIRLKTHQSTLEEEKQKLQQSLQEFNSLQSRYKSLESEVEERKTENSMLRERYNAVNLIMSDAVNSKTQLEEEIKRLGDELKKKEEEIRKEKEHVVSLEDRIKMTMSNIELVQKELGHHRELEIEITKLKSQLDSAHQIIAQLRHPQ